MTRLFNNLHFLYSFLITLFLAGSAILTGFATKNPLYPLIFLPLLGYFLISFYRRLYHWSYQANAETDPSSFHFLLFLSQDNPLFLVTLGLLLLAFSLSIIKGLLLP